MLNLALVHLLMTPGMIALDVGLKVILIPLFLSPGIMLISWRISKRTAIKSDDFVRQHWLLALKRYRILLIAYTITAALILLGHLLTLSSPDCGDDLLFLETSAPGLASRGGLPESKRHQASP